MKKVFYDTGVIFMAFLVLLSTASFTVDKHFCGSILVDSSVFSKAQTCGMENHSDSIQDVASVKAGMCCSNEKVEVEGQDELKVSFQSFDLDQQIFLSSFTYSFLEIFKGRILQPVPFRNYSPPLLVSDIQVLDQVFLI